MHSDKDRKSSNPVIQVAKISPIVSAMTKLSMTVTPLRFSGDWLAPFDGLRRPTQVKML
jgi:hypothetical protein